MGCSFIIALFRFKVNKGIHWAVRTVAAAFIKIYEILWIYVRLVYCRCSIKSWVYNGGWWIGTFFFAPHWWCWIGTFLFAPHWLTVHDIAKCLLHNGAVPKRKSCNTVIMNKAFVVKRRQCNFPLIDGLKAVFLSRYSGRMSSPDVTVTQYRLEQVVRQTLLGMLADIFCRALLCIWNINVVNELDIGWWLTSSAFTL